MHFHILDLFFRTLIYGLTVGFARRCNPFGRRKGARTLTCIKIISAFSAEIELKGVRVLPTSCGRRTAEHDACYLKKGGKCCLLSLSILYFKIAVASRLIYRLNTARNGSNFAFMRLVVYFPDMLIYLAETAVIFDVYSEISSEQANRIKLSPWLKELQRKEESNCHRTNRTERTTTERANPLG